MAPEAGGTAPSGEARRSAAAEATAWAAATATMVSVLAAGAVPRVQPVVSKAVHRAGLHLHFRHDAASALSFNTALPEVRSAATVVAAAARVAALAVAVPVELRRGASPRAAATSATLAAIGAHGMVDARRVAAAIADGIVVDAQSMAVAPLHALLCSSGAAAGAAERAVGSLVTLLPGELQASLVGRSLETARPTLTRGRRGGAGPGAPLGERWGARRGGTPAHCLRAQFCLWY